MANGDQQEISEKLSDFLAKAEHIVPTVRPLAPSLQDFHTIQFFYVVRRSLISSMTECSWQIKIMCLKKVSKAEISDDSRWENKGTSQLHTCKAGHLRYSGQGKFPKSVISSRQKKFMDTSLHSILLHAKWWLCHHSSSCAETRRLVRRKARKCRLVIQSILTCLDTLLLSITTVQVIIFGSLLYSLILLEQLWTTSREYVLNFLFLDKSPVLPSEVQRELI